MDGPQPAVPPRTPPKMKVGVNYAWFSNLYGNHIGPNRWKEPPDSQKDPCWEELGGTLAKNLRQLAAVGVKVVRMFILCQGDNYRRNLTSYPSKVPSGKWDPPPSLHPLFLAHFTKLLQEFKNQKMQFIPSLIDFKFPAWEDRDVIFTDDGKRDAFLDTALEPLLGVSKNFADQIFAWEVINEPSWLTRRLSPPVGRRGIAFLSEERMKTFLEKALERIKKAGFESTVGHRFLEDLDTFPAGTKRQYHYYPRRIATFPIDINTPDPFPIPTFGKAQAFMGEFSAHPHGAEGDMWPECDGADVNPANTVFERLKLLARKNYELGMTWTELPDNIKDDLKFGPQTLDGIKRFTQGLFPNGIP